ncbi:hypothetical protein [Streptococcus suis]|uniref:hypothetical protein n=1 Tax=Streptococcus suis TaxID=1307 RepID=UPI0038BCDF4F
MDKQILDTIDFSKISSISPYVKRVSPNDVFFSTLQMEGFSWNHNNNNQNFYKKIVSNLNKVEQLLDRGLDLDSIKQRYPESAAIIDGNYGTNTIQVYQTSDGKFLFSGNDGRHRLRMAQKLNIPSVTVKIIGVYRQPILTTSSIPTPSPLISASSGIATMELLGEGIIHIHKQIEVQQSSFNNESARLNHLGKLVSYYFSDQDEGRLIVDLLNSKQTTLNNLNKILSGVQQILEEYRKKINS